jgi:hypothetical protein
LLKRLGIAVEMHPEMAQERCEKQVTC